jgi:hypothetical protein
VIQASGGTKSAMSTLPEVYILYPDGSKFPVPSSIVQDSELVKLRSDNVIELNSIDEKFSLISILGQLRCNHSLIEVLTRSDFTNYTFNQSELRAIYANPIASMISTMKGYTSINYNLDRLSLNLWFRISQDHRIPFLPYHTHLLGIMTAGINSSHSEMYPPSDRTVFKLEPIIKNLVNLVHTLHKARVNLVILHPICYFKILFNNLMKSLKDPVIRFALSESFISENLHADIHHNIINEICLTLVFVSLNTPKQFEDTLSKKPYILEKYGVQLLKVFLKYNTDVIPTIIHSMSAYRQHYHLYEIADLLVFYKYEHVNVAFNVQWTGKVVNMTLHDIRDEDPRSAIIDNLFKVRGSERYIETLLTRSVIYKNLNMLEELLKRGAAGRIYIVLSNLLQCSNSFIDRLVQITELYPQLEVEISLWNDPNALTTKILNHHQFSWILNHLEFLGLCRFTLSSLKQQCEKRILDSLNDDSVKRELIFFIDHHIPNFLSDSYPHLIGEKSIVKHAVDYLNNRVSITSLFIDIIERESVDDWNRLRYIFATSKTASIKISLNNLVNNRVINQILIDIKKKFPFKFTFDIGKTTHGEVQALESHEHLDLLIHMIVPNCEEWIRMALRYDPLWELTAHKLNRTFIDEMLSLSGSRRSALEQSMKFARIRI